MICAPLESVHLDSLGIQTKTLLLVTEEFLNLSYVSVMTVNRTQSCSSHLCVDLPGVE